MSRTTRIAALAAAAALALAGCATSEPTTSTATTSTSSAPAPVAQSAFGCSANGQQAILRRINEARQAGLCGDARLGAAQPLTWQPALAATASKRASEIAQRGSFGRITDVSPRLRQDGYVPSAAQEWQAAGDYSSDGAAAALLAQQKQCTTLLNPRFTDIGAACVTRPGSEFKHYWTVVVANGKATRSEMGANAAKKPVAKKNAAKSTPRKASKAAATRKSSAKPTKSNRKPAAKSKASTAPVR
ncbi:CAP domain-containing protein [Ramlibacter algicola]|uniref:SCP domain-containing protein n=1 Tax=Ramlibacter algicola TaxID=2795217 RepID=A0A934UTN6_9BURK|nr:CAP domain-containing protein [Ramlibacter algicola]MBK0394943.1 hypothetical protein [Ramlibacter algicola]